MTSRRSGVPAPSTPELPNDAPCFEGVLAAQRSLVGRGTFDPGTAPEEPVDLFRAWFLEAVEAGVPESHAMTLSTVDATGLPDARVLILKALDGGRFGFAGGAESAKGRELAVAPAAALTFWWQPLARSVRIRGRVEEGTADESRADFRERGASARAAALVSGGAPLDSRLALESEVRSVEPDVVDPRWRRWWLTPDSVEFWQGDAARLHTRLRYDRSSDGWVRRLLRP